MLATESALWPNALVKSSKKNSPINPPE